MPAPSTVTPAPAVADAGRRQALSHGLRVAALLAGAGLAAPAARAGWTAAAFDTRNVNEAVRLLGGRVPAESRDVQIGGPDIADNGASVPVTLGTTLPDVRRLVLLVERNPAALAAVFDLSAGVDAQFATRIKMAESSWVYAVAITGDGRAFFARRDVKVTLGGCGN